jgi:starch-binding outer membrane protein SusE/F
MKKILKFSILTVLIFIVSCTTESKDPITVANGLVVNSDTSIIPSTSLTIANETNTFGIYNWGLSDNGSTSIAKYSLVVFDRDKDPNLLNPSEYNGTGVVVTLDSRKATITNKELNDLINKLPTFKCSEMNIDIRIKSSVGANPAIAFVQYSNPISVKVTGFSTKNKVCSFVKDGETINKGFNLVSSSFLNSNDFEGYFYLQAGSYKLYQPDGCGDFTTPTIYGGVTNVLTAGSATSINVATTGYYQIKADLSNLTKTYSIKFYKAFGLFGNAKSASGTANAVPMIDTNNKNIWKITLNLFKGRSFQFKSNDWTAALTGTPPSVPSGAGTTTVSTLGASGVNNGIIEPGSAILVPGSVGTGSQKYDITLDLSNPRKYTYKMVVNNN